LDGFYRFAPGGNGLPVGIRGAGSGPAVFFHIEYDRNAGIGAFDLTARFEGEMCILEEKERIYRDGLTLVGQVQ
jgi:hypothetical protein